MVRGMRPSVSRACGMWVSQMVDKRIAEGLRYCWGVLMSKGFMQRCGVCGRIDHSGNSEVEIVEGRVECSVMNG